MTIRQQTQVTVLMSGGLDSLSCAHFLLKRGLRVHGLFIDHGQPAARPEARASTALCPRFQVKVFQMSQRSLNTVQKIIEGPMLISAYDLHYREIARSFDFANLLFLDSGGYEASKDADLSDFGERDHVPRKWTLEMYE